MHYAASASLLEDAGRRFGRAFDHGVIGMALVRFDRRCLRVNEALSDMLCYSPVELLGLDLGSVVHPADVVEMARQVERLATGEVSSVALDTRCVRADGKVLEAHVAIETIRDEEGTPLYNFMQIVDITARSNAVRRFERTVATATDAFVGVGADGAVTEWNAAASKMFGWSRAEATGRSLAELIVPPDLRGAHRRGIARASRGETSGVLGSTVELQAVRRSGLTFPAELTIWRSDTDGGVVEFNAFIRDVSERVDAAAELGRLTRRTSLLLAASGEGIFGIDLEGIATFVNPRAAKLLGHEPADLVGADIHALIHAGHEDGRPYPKDACPIHRTIVEGLACRVVNEALWRADGTWFPAEYSSHPIIEHGQVVGAAVTFSDISSRLAAERELRASEERWRLTLDHAPIGIAIVELDGRWSRVNTALCQMIGYTEEELLALTFQDITHPEDLDGDLSLVAELLAGTRSSYQLEKRYVHRDGHQVWVNLSVALVRTDDGRAQHFISQIEDITARRAERETLARFAMTDQLTGLANRRAFITALEQAHAGGRRHGRRFGVVYIDLTRFKAVNDSYGHAAGDELLQQVATRLRGCLRVEDTVARLGGDEFAAVCAEVDHETARQALQLRLEAALTEPFFLADGEVAIGASIGIVVAEPDAPASAALAAADAAMYAYKRAHLL